MKNYTPPAFKQSAFNCPYCSTYSHHLWNEPPYFHFENGSSRPIARKNEDLALSLCNHCHKISIWKNELLIEPRTALAPMPIDDMPEDVKQDYLEARSIVNISPKGAAALLRLALQKLCKHLGMPGKNINDDIAQLVKNGLSIKIQQALDTLRVVGNNAVHPGLINIDDNSDIANTLFVCLNIICEDLITKPKEIDEMYNSIIPQNLKDAIAKRDS